MPFVARLCLYLCSVLLVTLLEDQRLTGHATPNVVDILDHRFKVRGRIIGTCDVDIVVAARIDRLFKGRDCHKLVMNFTKQIETGAQLEFWLVCFNDRRHLCNINTRRANVVGRRYFSDVYIILPAHLVLRDDKLY